MSIDPKANYYDAGGIETMAIIRAKLTAEQFEGFLIGNILKYISRINYKSASLRDIEKVIVYANILKSEFEIDRDSAVEEGGDSCG